MYPLSTILRTLEKTRINLASFQAKGIEMTKNKDVQVGKSSVKVKDAAFEI